MSSLGYHEMKLSGWGGTSPHHAKVFRPARLRELESCLQFTNGLPGIPRGLGRSYGDSATLENGNVILNERLNRMLEFDASRGVLTCEAGVSFKEILETFVPRGFFLPVTPGTKFVSVGGAIAADVHGKNHHLHGSLGNFVEWIDLMTGTHEQIRCSPTEHSELFWGTLGGMGLTGYIVRAAIRLLPIQTSRIVVDYERLPNLDALLASYLDVADTATYSVAWVDFVSTGNQLGRSVLMRGEHATIDALTTKDRSAPLAYSLPRKKSVPFHFPNFALNPLSVRWFNSAYYAMHQSRENVVSSIDSFFYPLDAVANWNRIYGKRGFIQYQALLPTHTSREGIPKLVQAIVDARIGSFLAVLKRTGPATPGPLSFCFPGITLALDLPMKRHGMRELTERLDQIVLDYAGRLYLAKDSMMSAETFAQMYPRLPEFQQLCSQWDPEHRFASAQAKRLRIIP